MDEDSAPFGPHALVIEWDADGLEAMRRAKHKDTRSMRGVAFTVLHEGEPVAHGGIWVAVTLPRARFLELMQIYMDSKGSVPLAHCVHDYLDRLAFDGGIFPTMN